jgi:hypothetical protein
MNHEGVTTMLAEIFVLRLEAMARSSGPAERTTTPSTSPFVPITPSAPAKRKPVASP